MKIINKTLTMIFLALACLSIFISCSAENAKPGAQSETGSITFCVGNKERTFEDSYEYTDIESLWWYYTAEMTGENGAKIINLVEIKPSGKGLLKKTVSGFSEGEWLITIYGFNIPNGVTNDYGVTGLTKIGAEAKSTLVYEGAGTAEVVAGTSVDVPIALKAMKTTGQLQLKDFTFEYKCSEAVTDSPSVRITITNNETKEELGVSANIEEALSNNKAALKINSTDDGTVSGPLTLDVGTYTFSVTSAEDAAGKTNYIVEGDTTGTFAIIGDCVTYLSGEIYTKVNAVSLYENEKKLKTVYASDNCTVDLPNNLKFETTEKGSGLWYKLAGWKDQNEKDFTFGTTPVTSDLTLTAQFGYLYENYGDDGPGGGWIFYNIEKENKEAIGSHEGDWLYLECWKQDVTWTSGEAHAYPFSCFRPDGNTNTAINGYVKNGITYNTSRDIGTGKENTAAIHALMGSHGYSTAETDDNNENYAARLVEFKFNDHQKDFGNTGDKSDWFLPSFEEMKAVNNNLPTGKIDTSMDRWTSSEDSATSALRVSGNGGSAASKYNYYYIRPVRRF